MDCKDCEDLLERFADGELDSPNRTSVESHLEKCPACAQRIKNLKTLHTALRDKSFYFKAPAGLRERILTQARSLAQAEDRMQRPSRRPILRWSATAAATVALVLTGLSYVYYSSRAGREAFVQEMISAHVRSLMANHLADVVSTDRHTVKPWFTGKLDFAPQVEDFPAKEFVLTGGRLDYVNRRPVAALIYQHRKHTINVFTWPASGQDMELSVPITRQGFNAINWRQGGMEYWMISDLNLPEMQEFSSLIQEANK